jgi:hypothetical protein
VTITEAQTELRCPVNASRLFGKVIASQKVVVTDGNLMEFACHDCLRDRRRKGSTVARVLHRFNFLGVHIETVEVPAP